MSGITTRAGATPQSSVPGSGTALNDPRETLQVFLDYLPSGVTLFGPDLEMVACNAKLRELLDLPEELFAQGLPSLPTLLRFNAMRGDYGPGDPEVIAAAAIERAKAMQPHVFERTRPNGVVLEVRGMPLPEGGFVTIYTDITERKQSEKALRESAEQLRMFADNVPSMTVSWDENLRCRFANKRFAEFFGIPVENLLGKHVREVIGDDAFRDVESHYEQVLQGQPSEYQRLRKLANGRSRYVEIKLMPNVADDGRIMGCYAVTTDITEQKQAEERIQHLAHHDSLTGLPNRLLFNDRLAQSISLARRDSGRFALLYLDLDKFKPVNDTLGHNVGDKLLRDVASRLREQVRESDTVARVGGDEFTVILRDINSRENVAAVAEKIIAALARPFHLELQKQSVHIGASVGITIYPDDAQDHDTLIKLADAAMYNAKTQGSCFRFFAA
jgi:diguanylate cyclase (GGDEF)-like protein/PAS domain S-box-containing protein